jgi:pentatricopeptide repeat protein
MSPAAIVSAVHQHIVFGPRQWNIPDVKANDTPLRKEDKTRVHGYVQPIRGTRSTSAGLPLKHPPHFPTSTTADLEALADDLEAHAATSSCADALPRIYRKQSLRPRLLVVLATTQDAASAWAAYRALMVLPRSSEKARPKVPFSHRHRLLRLLAAAPRPRPRGRFAQVLSVLRALQDAGGTVQRWQWNLLLDCAGKEGWRRPREEHFRAALGLLAQMKKRTDDGRNTEGGVGALEPDLYSYTTLIAHAVRTGAPAAVRHAMQLLARAGLSPGVHAHTALLCFFARQGDLAGVRNTLFRMRQAREGGLEQVPFNAVLWAFGYNGRLDVARTMYRVVCARRASESEEGIGRREEEEEERGQEEEEEEELEAKLAEREMVFIARDVVPDAATYHILIQACAYHGDLRGSLEMLADMLSASATAVTSASRLAAFRAIFLGFARHGVANANANAKAPPSFATVLPSEWTLPTLEALFVRFLELELSRDARMRLRENTLFWLVSAFVRTSGHDADVLRGVFERVEDRFGYVWTSSGTAGGSGRLERIRERFIS